MHCFLLLGIGTALLGVTFDDIGTESDIISWHQICTSVTAVPKQFIYDARAGLLAPFVFGFGITTAMFCYYVNFNIITSSSTLGMASIGFFESFSYLIAIIAAYPYAYVSNSYADGRHWVMLFGSLSFCMCGVAVFFFSNDQLSIWWIMLIVKLFYGLGRGVFEGSCRAVYAELFTGDDLPTAFSGQTLSAGFSGGVCFFMYGCLQKESIASITMINGLLALLTYSVLMKLDNTKPVAWSEIFTSKIFVGSLSQGRSSTRLPLNLSFSGLPTYSLLQMEQTTQPRTVASPKVPFQ